MVYKAEGKNSRDVCLTVPHAHLYTYIMPKTTKFSHNFPSHSCGVRLFDCPRPEIKCIDEKKKLKKVGLVAAAIIHCWWQMPININGPQNTYNAHVKTTSSPCGAVVNPPVTKTMFCHFCQNHTINVILISMAFSHLLHLFYDQANLKCVAPFLPENPPK